MKFHRSVRFTLFLLIGSILVPSAAFSQDQQRTPSPKPMTPEERAKKFPKREERLKNKSKANKEIGQPTADSAQSDNPDDWPDVKFRNRQMERLLEAIKAKVGPTADQTKVLERVFAEYKSELEKSVNQKVMLKTDPVRPQDVTELYGQYTKASQSGKAAEAEGYLGRIRDLRKKSRPHVSMDPNAWAYTLVAELNPVQAPMLFNVIERWNILDFRSMEEGPILKLMRALSDPEVKLSEAERTEFQNIVSEAYKQVPQEERKPKKMAEIAQQSRDKIFNKLTPVQVAQIENNLAEMEKVSAVDPSGMDGNKPPAKDASPEKKGPKSVISGPADRAGTSDGASNPEAKPNAASAPKPEESPKTGVPPKSETAPKAEPPVKP